MKKLALLLLLISSTAYADTDVTRTTKIGSIVTGGTDNRVLYLDGTTPKLSQSSGLTYDVTTSTLASGTITSGGFNLQQRALLFNVSTTIASATTTTGQNCAGDDGISIPAILDGFNVTSVTARVTSANTSGTFTANIRNRTDATNILSTALTIDATELTSITAATPAVINQTNSRIATSDDICIQVTETGTGHSGARVEMVVQK